MKSERLTLFGFIALVSATTVYWWLTWNGCGSPIFVGDSPPECAP